MGVNLLVWWRGRGEEGLQFEGFVPGGVECLVGRFGFLASGFFAWLEAYQTVGV